MPRAKQVNEFDPGKLQQMTEPLTVRVEKLKGNAKQPIEIAGKGDGMPPGTGLERDDVLKLEPYILDLCGGGYYRGRVTDAEGKTMQWDFGWDPRVFPEKVPPNIQDSAAYPAQPPPGPGQMIPPQTDPFAAAAALGGGGAGFGGFPTESSWPPPVNSYTNTYQWGRPAQGAATPRAPWGSGQPNWWSNMPWNLNPLGFGAPPTPAQNGEDVRTRHLEERLKEVERQRLEESYRANLERMQGDHAREMDALKEELRRIHETTRKPDESEEVKLLRQQMEQQRMENERIRAEQAMRELRDSTQQQLQAIQAANQQQIDRLAMMLEKLAEGSKSGESEQLRMMREEMNRERERAERDRQEQRHRDEMRMLQEQINASKGPDPMVEFMKENSRNQLEAAREMARQQQAQAQQMQHLMVNPIQMADMLSKSSSGSEAFLQNVITNFGGLFDTYRMAMEHMMQMSGGNQSPGMAMLQEGISRAQEIANQYISYQRDKAVSEARARSEAARAQTMTAEAMRRQQAGEPPTNGVNGTNGANGQAAGLNGAAADKADKAPAAVIDMESRRRGNPVTDKEMFGEAFDDVMRLREGIANGNLDEKTTVQAILQGVMVVQQKQLVIPVFTLFETGQIPDFIDALIPTATAAFRDTVTQIMLKHLQEMESGPDVGEPDVDDDEDDQPQPSA